MNLYEINSQILDCIDQETGEVMDIDRLEELNMAKADKVDNIACWVKNLEADVLAFEAQEKAFADRKEAAKRTDTGRLLSDRVSAEQAACLRRISRLGGIAFVLCSFNGREFYRIPWPIWEDMKDVFGRKYITPADLAEYRIRVAAPGVLLFLEGVKEKRDGSQMDT